MMTRPWTARRRSTTPLTWKRLPAAPRGAPPTKEQWLLRNFHGIMDYLVGELEMTREELAREFLIWRRWTTSRIPPFFPGFLDLLAEFRQRGGLVAVISHSEKDVIEGHYRAARNLRFVPDLMFGWDHDEKRRKPSPWPVQEALRQLDCSPAQALVVDDLKPGILMSRAAGCDFAAAGWSHRVPEIEGYMRAQRRGVLRAGRGSARCSLSDARS